MKKVIFKIKTIFIIFLLIIGIFYCKNTLFKINKNIDVNNAKLVSNTVITNKNIKTLIDSIKISEATHNGYNRKTWESPVRKFICPITGKKESIRNYAIDISNCTKRNINKNFEFLDPYTGTTITDKSDIEYDHLIPLGYVQEHGADTWTNTQKNEYAFNINNGIPASKTQNRIKSDRGPSKYMPKVNQKEYCYTWLIIASKYHITLDKADMDTIKSVLKNVDSAKIINTYK